MSIQNCIHRLARLLTVVVLLFGSTAAWAQLVGCLKSQVVPVASSDYVIWPGGPVIVDVLGNDYDEDGDPLAITQFSPGANGTVAYTEDFEALVYTPTNSSATNDQFSYSVSDGQFTITGTVFLTADPIEPPPPPPPPAQVSFTYSCNNGVCHFTATWAGIVDTPRYFHWEFSDGSSTPPGYNIPNVSHGFSPGTRWAKVTVTFLSGIVKASEQLPVVVAAPTILCMWEGGPYGLTFNARVRTVTDQNGHPVQYDNFRYFWDFQNGQGEGEVDHFLLFQNLYGANYTTPGTRTINFIVKTSDLSAVVGQCPQVHDIVNEPPQPDFEAVPGDGVTRAKKLFRFTPTAWDEWYNQLGPWEWSFGDGGSATTSGPSGIDHYYPRPGNYTVTLKVTDSLGAVGTKEKTITVEDEPPIANWQFNCRGRTCTFDASLSFDDSDVVTYRWNFGDNTPMVSLEQRTVDHTFAADGSFDVTLTVDDGTNQVSKVRRVSPRGAALAPGGLVFYTLPPCRLFDSRLEGRPPLTTNVPVNVTVAGNCGVPADAKAIAVSAAVISPTEAVRVYFYRTGAQIPIGSALISTPDRSPRANNTVIPLSAEGSITTMPVVGTTGTTHLTVDITGYFSESLTGLPPARGPMRYDRSGVFRVYDSRTQSAPLTAGAPRLLDLRNPSSLPLPLAAEAHALNITAITPSNTGHFVLYPSDLLAAPITSALNVQAGISQSNGSLMGLGRRDNDDVVLTYSGTSTHFTVDTYGWFAKDAKYRYYPIEPCRAFDTREAPTGSPRIPANSNRSVQIQGNCGVPYDTKYAVTTTRILAPDAAGAAQIGSIFDPSITNIQYAAGNDIANTVIVGLSGIPAAGCCTQDMSVTLTGGGADVAVDVIGYFLPEINRPPTVANENVTAVINVPLTIDVLANDSDANGDTIKLSTTRPIFNPPLLGTATRASDSTVTYNSTLAGDDGFDYEIVDTRGGISHGRVTVNVRATNEAPVANPDSAATAANSSVTIDVLANDSDPEGDPLQITSVSTPEQGTAEIRTDRILYTPNPTASGTDEFKYAITDAFGAPASSTVTITISGVNSPPHTNEDSATVYVGESVAITPVANDTDPDGDPLALSDPAITEAPSLGTAVRTNDTTITYTAGLTPGSDVFQYSIHDGRGGTARGSISVTVEPTCSAPPAISAQPSSQTINAGGPATLTVTATGGSRPLTYQWYQGTAPLATTPVGTNSNSLTVTPSATTSYWVNVTNDCGSTASATGTVTVCNPAGIATQPASQSITVGTAATLTVAASGSGPFSYQWYEGATGTTALPVGTNGATFTTPALTGNKSYWVRVTSTCNGSSSVDSATADITVTCSGAPIITAQPTSRTINAGSPTTFTVAATQAASYQWYEGTAPSTTTPVGTNSNSLTVTPAATTSYWVNVSNSCGPTASNTATVTVCNPLGIATQPASQSITAGSTATLNVVASGSGPFSYQWYEGTSGLAVTPVGTNSPTFTTPALSATKSYWVKVTSTCNGTSTVNSTTATVTVNCATPPVIITPPAPRTINAGQSTTLTVVVDSVGPTTFQWYQGAPGVTTTPVGTNSNSITVTPAATTSYWVRVTNNCGSTDSGSVLVTVCTPVGITTQPGSPTIPYNTTATLTVTASGSGPLSYQWYLGPSGTTITPVGTNSASFTTPALTASTQYWVRVTSTCNGTTTVNSNTATVTVTCAAPPSITAHPTSRTINLGQPTTLTVTASSPGSTPVYQWYQGTAPSTTTPVGTNSNSLTVTPGATTNYWVKVTNACGPTNSTTATVTVCTPPSITTHPASTTIAYNATATLSVAAAGSAPLTYQWYEGASGVTTTPVGTNSSSFTTPSLTATKSYWVKVTSTCNGTASVNSNAATVTVTPQQIARRQTAFALADSQQSITASWPQPTQAGNLLVAVISAQRDWYPIANFSPPAGWQLAVAYEMPFVKTAIYYYPNNPGGRTSEAFTNGGYFDEMTLHLLEYSGVMTTNPLDKTAFNGNHTNGGYPETGYTANTVQPKELVITSMVTHATTGFSAPSGGFIELYDHTQSWWHFTSATHERITIAAGSQGHYATVGVDAEWVGIVATFKAANTN